jgi:hypothetical protein
MKSIYYFLFASVLFLTSCSKNEVKPPTKEINTDLISEVENLSNKVSVQKLSYHLLKADEKATLWVNQLDYYLSSDLNDGQKDALRTLKNAISPNMFEQDDSFQKKYEAFGKGWYNSALKVFSKDVLSTIVSQIHTKEYALDYISATKSSNVGSGSTVSLNSLKATALAASAESGCTCSTSSDYCGDFYRCSSSFFSCTSSSFGCGLFLTYGCNGTCVSGA